MTITFNTPTCKHSYVMYGKHYEYCVKCHMQNPEVTHYNQALCKAMQEGNDTMQIVHPYIADGRWSGRQRDRYMRVRR